MPLQIVRNDITKMEVDAIVNTADASLLGGGGVDGAVHKTAGARLLKACRALGGCAVGQAKITKAYDLPCKYVIHTVSPAWRGGLCGEKQLLSSCYRSALGLARENGCESVAFPLIAAGNHGYPKDKAMKVAIDTIGEFLLEQDMTVYLVIFEQESVAIGHKLFADIQEYIDNHYVDAYERIYNQRRREWESGIDSAPVDMALPMAEKMPCPKIKPEAANRPVPHTAPSPDSGERFSLSLDERLEEIDESFQQMLLRMIDEKGMTDTQCYKKANIDRKLFSKIRKDTQYRPSKTTAIAFAVALELDMKETEELLRKAGFALSQSSKSDIIVQYFIERRSYNIFEINEVLFYYDQGLLGTGG